MSPHSVRFLLVGGIVALLVALAYFFGFFAILGLQSKPSTKPVDATDLLIIDEHPFFNVTQNKDYLPDIGEIADRPIEYKTIPVKLVNEVQPISYSWDEDSPYASYRIARSAEESPTILLHLNADEFQQYSWSETQITRLANILIYQALLETIANDPDGMPGEVGDGSSEFRQQTQHKAQLLLEAHQNHSLIHIMRE